MTTTETPNRPALSIYLATAPARGFTVVEIDPTTWLLVDAYGDGSTDEAVTLRHDLRGDFYTVEPASGF